MARSAAGGAPGSGQRGPVSREGSPSGLCGAHLQGRARDTHLPRSKRGQKGPPHHWPAVLPAQRAPRVGCSPRRPELGLTLTLLPTAGRENTSSFPNMRKFVDVCEILEVANGVTVLPKDGNRWRRALWSRSTPHLAPLRLVELTRGAWGGAGRQGCLSRDLQPAAKVRHGSAPIASSVSTWPAPPTGPQGWGARRGARHAFWSGPCSCGWTTQAACPGALQCPRPAHVRPGRAKEHWWADGPPQSSAPSAPPPSHSLLCTHHPALRASRPLVHPLSPAGLQLRSA